MKSLSIILVAVLCVYSNAETIIGEFSGKLDTTGIFFGAALEFFEEVGANHGDIIYGKFAYQSDAEVSRVLEGSNICPAEYIWVQVGDRIIEHNDVAAYVAPGGRSEGIFALTHGSDFVFGETSPVEFLMFGSEEGTPVFSHDLPLSKEDINLEIPWSVSIPVNSSFRVSVSLTESEFELGPECNETTNGDLNGDGKIAFDDFLSLSANFGNEVSGHLAGDIDCNGVVQFADFLILSTNFGKELTDVTLVPEPGLSCLFLAFLCLPLHPCFTCWRNSNARSSMRLRTLKRQ